MLTLEQVCKRLAVSRHSAIRLIDEGHLQAIKVNGRYRIDPAWVDAYIENALAQTK